MKPKPQKPSQPRAERKKKAVATPAGSNWTPPRGPDELLAGSVAFSPTAAGVDTRSDVFPLLLAAALVLSLLLVLLAATPPWVLPRQMAIVAYHREALLYGGLVTAASIALGLAIALLGS